MKKMLALGFAGALTLGAGLLVAPQDAQAQVGFSVGYGSGWGGGYYGRRWGGPYVSVGAGYYGGYPYYGGYSYGYPSYGYYGAPVVTRRIVVRPAPTYYVRPRVVTRRVVYRSPRYVTRRAYW